MGKQLARRNLSPTERAAIWQAHNRRCAYTGVQVPLSDLEIDHIIPFSVDAKELDELKADGVIPTDFDLDGLGNLLPTTRFQNNRKRANVRTKSHLLHFLGVAEQYRSAVEHYIRASTGEDKVLSAFLRLKAQAEQNDLTVDDIIDIQRQQADGVTRVRLSPQVQGAQDSTLLNAELAAELMKKPFALGGGHITEVVLQTHDGHEVKCRDCNAFLEAVKEKYWPKTQFDINCYSMASQNCDMLRALEHARYAPASLIRYPRVTCKDLDRWSGEWVRSISIDIQDAEAKVLFTLGTSIRDLVERGACEVVSLSDWHFDVRSKYGLAVIVSELFRADLDGDGAEEILVFPLTYAPGGTLRAGVVEVARPAIDGLIYPEAVGAGGEAPTGDT
ncbi:HNH endonuclease [Reyranella sp.]|uniref:HNH endonuclease n=1 Tax=Reyranella sp. TaxID=1929291 RepID=UPI003BABE47D